MVKAQEAKEVRESPETTEIPRIPVEHVDEQTYRRISSYESGNDMLPRFVDKDVEAWSLIEQSFPYWAELAWRDGGGKREIPAIYDGRSPINRKDKFDPRYIIPCPFPKADSQKNAIGKWSERCMHRIRVPEEGTKEHNDAVRRYNLRPTKRGTVWSNIGLRQFLAMEHCISHFEWYKDEFGIRQEMGGKLYLRPPQESGVVLPEWILE